MKFKFSINIKATPKEVFSMMTNTRLLKKWMLDLTSVKETSGSRSKVGHQSILVFGKGDGKIEVEETIAQYEPAKALALNLESRSMKSYQSFQFETINSDQTRLVADIKVNLRPMIINLMGLFLKPSIRNQQKEDLMRLKRLIEERN